MSSPLIRGVSYVGVSVSDLEKAVTFYTNACNLKSVEQKRLSGIDVLDALAGRSGVEAETHMLEGHNAQLRFMQFEAPSEVTKSTPPVPVVGPGFAHVCFQALKERKRYQRVLDAGATAIGSPDMVRLRPGGMVEYAYVHDFDGRVFEVEQMDTDVGDRAATKLRYGDHRLGHISVATPDIDRLLNFYASFLDIDEPRQSGLLAGEPFDKVAGHDGVNLKMAWCPIGAFEVEMTQYLSHPTELPESPRPIDAVGYNMVVLDVGDRTAAAEKLTAAGGTIVSEPATMDGGEIVFAHDPDGNLLGLLEAPKEALVSTSRFHDRHDESDHDV